MNTNMLFDKMSAGPLCLVLYVLHSRGKGKGKIMKVEYTYVNIYIFICHMLL